MSAAGRIWTASKQKLYGIGAGMAHPSVKHVTCPVCHAPPGKLCIGSSGQLSLTRHWRRASAFQDLKRSLRTAAKRLVVF